MTQKKGLIIKKIGLVFFSLLIILFVALCHSPSNEDMFEAALGAYKKQKSGNITKSNSLYEKALDFASKRSWKVYRSSEVQKAIDESRKRQSQNWNGTDEQKLEGLMRVYHSVKNHFAGFDMVPELDWDWRVRASVPEVIKAETMEDYYRVLLKLVANVMGTGPGNSIIIRSLVALFHRKKGLNWDFWGQKSSFILFGKLGSGLFRTSNPRESGDG